MREPLWQYNRAPSPVPAGVALTPAPSSNMEFDE